MHRCVTVLVVTAAGLAMPSAASAADIYVDDDSGDDTNPCITQAQPCKTIFSGDVVANNNGVPSDTIFVDGKASFKPCTSPLKFKVKKGKHSFAVQATDAAGNTDPTPATDRWKVKGKKK